MKEILALLLCCSTTVTVSAGDWSMFPPDELTQERFSISYPLPSAGRPKIKAYIAEWCQWCKVLEAQRDLLESWADVEWVEDGTSPSGRLPCLSWQDESGQTWYTTSGWNGLATVRTIKQNIYTPLESPDTRNLPPEAQPTPYPEVHEALKMLNLDRSKTFVDIGCGFDARFCVEATKLYGCRSTGIEIDHDRAVMARKYVDASGYGDRITVIEGDANDVEFDADAAVVFLWPDELERLRPKLESIEMVVALHHPVPGMEMQKSGDFYMYQNRKPRQQRFESDPIVATWNGRGYTESQVRAYLRGCGTCPMCKSLRRQTGY